MSARHPRAGTASLGQGRRTPSAVSPRHSCSVATATFVHGRHGHTHAVSTRPHSCNVGIVSSVQGRHRRTIGAIVTHEGRRRPKRSIRSVRSALTIGSNERGNAASEAIDTLWPPMQPRPSTEIGLPIDWVTIEAIDRQRDDTIEAIEARHEAIDEDDGLASLMQCRHGHTCTVSARAHTCRVSTAPVQCLRGLTRVSTRLAHAVAARPHTCNVGTASHGL